MRDGSSVRSSGGGFILVFGLDQAVRASHAAAVPARAAKRMRERGGARHAGGTGTAGGVEPWGQPFSRAATAVCSIRGATVCTATARLPTAATHPTAAVAVTGQRRGRLARARATWEGRCRGSARAGRVRGRRGAVMAAMCHRPRGCAQRIDGAAAMTGGEGMPSHRGRRCRHRCHATARTHCRGGAQGWRHPRVKAGSRWQRVRSTAAGAGRRGWAVPTV